MLSTPIPLPILIGRLSDGKILHTNRSFWVTLGSRNDEVISDSYISDLYFDPIDPKFHFPLEIHEGIIANYELLVKRLHDGKALW